MVHYGLEPERWQRGGAGVDVIGVDATEMMLR